MDREKDASDDIRNATYEEFLAASDFKQSIDTFERLCKTLDINPKNYKTVFSSLKSKLKLWKCQNLFNKLEKKSKHKDYQHKPCAKLKVLIIGAGPVGLRTAIEAAFLGAHVSVVEKRNTFSRNNVLHLWPFLIVDLKALGVKSFFGKFCAGSLDHISIRRLQCILLKMCLILGVQINGQTMIEGVIEPDDGTGWRANFKPESSPLNSMEFDAIVGCDGKNNALEFKRKEFRGKLAIAITCNFVNKQTSEEARVEEISGVAFIYNQEFFHQLFEQTGIELENIVYYKDETHYFVMTAKKQSLLSKGVIKQDSKDVFKLLSAENINHKKLCDFGKESADFATRYQLPHHEFARNHYGKEDVALFDFTSIHQAENASKIIERKGKRLLLCIAGDILLEPFWPTGSGCARGFLGAFDAAWMIRKLGLGADSIEMIQERESIFTILPQTKPDSLMSSFDKYSIDPSTRYCNLNTKILTKTQARAFFDCTSSPVHLSNICVKSDKQEVTKKEAKVYCKTIKDTIDPDNLLMWCREQTADFPNVSVTNLASSWKNGLAFCAIICRYHPELIDYSYLDPNDIESNCKKAFSVAEEHLGIPPKMSAHDFAEQKTPDTLAIVAYVSQYYEALKNETPAPLKKIEKRKLKTPETEIITNGYESPKMTKYSSKMSIVSKMSKNSKKKKKKLGKIVKSNNKENKILNQDNLSQLTSYEKTSNDIQENTHNVTLYEISQRTALTESSIESNKNINSIITTKPEENGINEPEKYRRISNLAEAVFGDTIVQMGNPKEKKVEKSDSNLAESEKCYFCNRKVFVMERQSAEGLFFHRKCFRCFICKCQLLLGNYVFHTDGDDQQLNDKFFCKMHYNKMIYDAEKKTEERKSAEQNKRPYSVLDIPKNDEKISRIRTATFGHIPSPKSSRIIDLQNRLQGTELSDINEDKKSKPQGPYEKFAARQLNRHPSLLKCGAKKVTTSSFFTSSKLSISTPNLSKLIQEDSMFEREREEHAIEQNSKVFTTDDFEENADGHLLRQASIRSTTSIESTVPISAVDRRPISERRAQYPVSMAFSEGLVHLRPVSVDIQIEESLYDGDKSSMEASTVEQVDTFEKEGPVKIKKKRLVLKKKKKLIPGKELSGDITSEKTDQVDSEDRFGIHTINEDVDVIMEPKEEPKRMISSIALPSRLDLIDDLSTSEDEMPIIKKKMGKKEKKQLAKERESKQKARDERRVKKEMKAREMKRLWEAQSIQRKLCEVDVKQYELEKRAKQVETGIRDDTLSVEKINELTFEWFRLVNEKNMLLRFESELVIAGNSIRLEDRQARLEDQIRSLLQNPNPKRSSQKEIDRLTKEHVDTVEERNALVELLEADRIREQEEDKLLQMTFSSKAHELGMDRLI